MMREYYCPHCAAALCVDVVVDGTPVLPVPRVARSDNRPTRAASAG
jgi:hypothetical protein